jgi:hypothetical protein
MSLLFTDKEEGCTTSSENSDFKLLQALKLIRFRICISDLFAHSILQNLQLHYEHTFSEVLYNVFALSCSEGKIEERSLQRLFDTLLSSLFLVSLIPFAFFYQFFLIIESRI